MHDTSSHRCCRCGVWTDYVEPSIERWMCFDCKDLFDVMSREMLEAFLGSTVGTM